MRADPFSKCHPAVNFLFFVCVIGFGVVIQHPAYLAAGIVGAGAYYLLLHGRKSLHMLGMLLPVVTLITVLNPLLNTSGKWVLFYLFGRKYTLEALCYGGAIAAMFAIMMLWFGCYSAVLTSDKFTSLFGNRIPSLSLLLVMVLRMIPSFARKGKQIQDARSCIGKGVFSNDRWMAKFAHGGNVLSALVDWALEGSIVTADSMRARGYGTGKRTNFQIYHITGQDICLLVLIGLLAAGVLLCGGTDAGFTPKLYADYVGPGFICYCLLLLIPIVLRIREDMIWHNLRSRM